MRTYSFAFFTLLLLALLISTCTAFADTYPILVSVSSDGTQGNNNSSDSVTGGGVPAPTISADGRFVAFVSSANNLAPGDTNNRTDVFVRDTLTDTTTRVSVASDGTQGNGDSRTASISPDGRYVAFTSLASNLVPGDDNNLRDVFIHDTQTGTTTRVSLASDGTQGNGTSVAPSISANNRYVAFSSDAPNLTTDDTNNTRDIFIHDTQTGTTTRLDASFCSQQSPDGGEAPSISRDARHVAFRILRPNTGAISNTGVICVHDVLTGAEVLADVAPDGTEGNVQSARRTAITDDGRYVAFSSDSSNLVPNDTNSASDIFVRDTLTDTTTRVSVASDGTQATSQTAANNVDPSISADGRFVVFASSADNLVQGDNNTTDDVFIHDTLTGATQRLNVSADGLEATAGGAQPSISADGRFIVYISASSGLVSGDANGFVDVFLTRNPLLIQNQAPVLVSIGNQVVNEGELLQFAVNANDPEDDTLTYSATNLPDGATFDPETHVFSWTPGFDQAGNYPNVEFTVTDDGSPMMLDFEDITITVGDVNRAPVIPPVGSQQVLEHDTLTFTVSATDPDGDGVTLSATGLPAGATFDPQTGVFTWTPGYPTAGVYTPTFVATDNGSPTASSSQDVVITVGSNPTPTEQAQTIVDTVVNDPNLPQNAENSYLANLNKVGTFIEQGKLNQAINQLNAFIQKVDQDYSHGTITQAEHDQFIALANALIADLQ